MRPESEPAPETPETPRDTAGENAPEGSPAKTGRLFDEATREAERYKWIESEKAGRDLGDRALQDWHRSYWRSWCRERWIEHLRGDTFWEELDRDDYGLLQRQFHDNLELAERIVERIKQGGENLDIIQWANENDYDTTTVLEVLKILDINSRRLAPPTEFVAEASIAPPEEEAGPRTKARRILVVDDDPDTGALLKELFEREGLECAVARSGEEAIAEVETRRFHCFLIDIMLPGKHGAEVAWYLRRHGITAPVIAISAVLEKWNEDDLYDCGFTGIMGKPFRLEELRDLARDIAGESA